MPRSAFWSVLIAMAATPVAAAQHSLPPASPDTVQLVPGPHYGAGAVHRWLLGDHYRDLWTRPIAVAVLDLDREAGGLVPECRVRDVETAELRLRGADGRRYVFRSADSDPTRAQLPAPLRRTAAADVLRDRGSSRLPAGALVVEPLLAAVGLPHAEPRLRAMPDHPALKEFREPFAGMLGTLEERSADEVVGTRQVWERIGASPADRVDARGYLAARLVDIVVGDGDRSFEQWAWVADSSGVGRVWQPIPRDHTQAFARLDGVVLSTARLYFPQLVTFGSSYPRMYGLTWSARALDRRFLVELDRPAWDSLAREVQRQLSDSVLEAAVRRLPPEFHETRGAELLASLTRRRDRLPEAVDAFYPLVAKWADVHATDQSDVADVERLDAERVRVRLAPAAAPGEAYFDRIFADSETVELRLYLDGGDDRVVVRGKVPRSLTVRVVGGPGDDELVDSSVVGLPIVNSVFTRTFVYDDEGENRFVPNPGTEIHREGFQPPKRRDAYPPPPPGACDAEPADLPPRDLGDPFRDWGSRWVVLPWASFQPNLGLLIGAGAVRHAYSFRKAPYGARITLRGAFATDPGRARLWYEGEFRNLPRGAWVSTTVRYSGIDLVGFYGLGNETALTAPSEHYRIVQRQVAAAAAITLFPPRSRVSIGPYFGYAATELGSGNLIDSLRPYGTPDFAEAGILARAELDTRDRALAPRRGVHAVAVGLMVPRILDVTEAYGSAGGETSVYLSVGDPARVTVALRAGGKQVWGRYPFHAAAYLGGATTLRGYAQQRFAGDAAVFGNAELRLFLVKTPRSLPGELGVFGLADLGRVYLAGEHSDRWHGAVGGGVWVAFIERGAGVNVAVARSPERVAWYGGLGFMF